MFTEHTTKIKKFCLTGMIMLTLIVGVIALPTSARAQGPVQIGTFFNYHSIMSNLKDFTLDKLATLMAKQILHQITASVINWINSGFHGSPSFLTNPAGFFLDAADQITGVFLSNGGPLSSLCSPFNINIRLALSLNNSSFNNKRYSCTLSSIISGQQGGININGKSITGFMKGDFSQGGWPAFISLTTETQNNPYDAYLAADSDLQYQIAVKQNSISADIKLGSGFMSWQDCKEIGTVDPDNQDQVDQAEAIVGGDTSIDRKINKDGSMTYQSCTTQTPGSVIAGTLQKSLNVPSDELELANDINAVINALISQMTTQMLTKGLGALSGGSGGQASYTNQIVQDSTSANSANTVQARHDAANNITTNMVATTNAIAIYDQATTTVAVSEQAYINARACFVAKINSQTYPGSSQYIFGQNQVAAITADLNDNVEPLIASLQAKRQNLISTLQQLASTSEDISGITANSSTMSSTDQINAQTSSLDNYINNLENNVNGSTNQNTANQDLNDAKTQAKQFANDAASYQKTCNAFPLHYGI